MDRWYSIAKCCVRHNRVSFCVVGRTQLLSQQFSTAFESVLVFGRIMCDLPEDERHKALNLLVAKYSPDFKDISRAYINKSFHRTLIMRLDIEHVSGKAEKINNCYSTIKKNFVKENDAFVKKYYATTNNNVFLRHQI